jgi:hypothetical protein
MEKIFICQQCHAELGEDEVDGILGHAVPDYDEDGCNQCGPCEMNRDWALARIKSLKECAAKMQKRILELAENEAVTSANYNGAVARIAELEAQLDIERDLTNKALDKLAELATNLEDQLAAAQERERVLNDDLKFALELAVAYAPNIKDQEWAAELIEQMDSPTPSQEADDEQD